MLFIGCQNVCTDPDDMLLEKKWAFIPFHIV